MTIGGLKTDWTPYAISPAVRRISVGTENLDRAQSWSIPMWLLRRLLETSWAGKLTDAEIPRGKKRSQELLAAINRRKATYFGCIDRDARYALLIIEGIIKGKPGRKMFSWRQNLRDLFHIWDAARIFRSAQYIEEYCIVIVDLQWRWSATEGQMSSASKTSRMAVPINKYILILPKARRTQYKHACHSTGPHRSNRRCNEINNATEIDSTSLPARGIPKKKEARTWNSTSDATN